MFKKLKEKITEEVKPFKLSQFTQPAATLSSSSLSAESINENFSPKDEIPEEFLGNDGFSIVDLQSPALSPPLARGRFSRQSSMSSLASDASFFPLHDALFGTHNVQSDLDVGSEKEDSTSQINSLSKQELYSAYIKLHRHYQKYKGRASDFKVFCEELERDNKKHKTILLECQEKSLRRMAELKEQCTLEQRAKAHLEEVLRNDLEEKDHLIKTLLTKIQLLKDSTGTNVCNEIQDRLSLIEVDMDSHLERSKDIALQPNQGHEATCGHSNKEEVVSQTPKIERQIIIGKIESLKHHLDEESFLNDENSEKRTELIRVLSEISEYLSCTPCVEDPLNTHTFENTQSNGYKTIFNTSDIVQIRCEAEKLAVTLSENSTQTCSEISNFVVNESSKLEFDRLLNEQQITNKLIENKECTIRELTQKLKVVESQLQESLRDNQTVLEAKLQIDRLLNEQQVTNKIIEKKECVIQELTKKVEVVESQLQEAVSYKQIALQSKLEIDRLLSEQQAVNKLIENKQCTIQELTKQVNVREQQLQETLSNKQQTEEFKLEIDRLLSEQQVTNKIIENKECTIQQLTKQVEKMESQLQESLKNDQAALEAKLEIDKLLNEQQDTNKIIDNKEGTIQELSKQVEVMESQLQEAVSDKQIALESKLEIDRLLSEQQANHKLIENKHCTIQELTEQMKVMENQLQEALIAKQQALEKISGYESVLEEYKTKISNSKELLTLKENELRKLELDISEMKSSDSQDLILSENSKLTEIITDLQKDVLNAKHFICQIIQEIQSSSEPVQDSTENFQEGNNDCKPENSMHSFVGSNLDLNVDLESQNDLCKQIQKEFTSLLNFINKKNSALMQANDTIRALNQKLEVCNLQNVEMNNTISSLQLELSDTIKKCDNELVEKQIAVDSKNSAIDKLTKDHISLNADLKKLLQEKSQVCETVNSLENELKMSKIQLDQMSKDLMSSYTLVEEKDSTIVSITKDLTDLHKELDAVSFQKAETNGIVESLQNELSGLNSQLEQVNIELQSTNKLIDEKDSTIASMSEDFSKICKELEFLSYQKSELQEKMSLVQNEHSDLKTQFQQVTDDLHITRKQLEQKDSEIEDLTRNLSTIEKDFKSSLSLKTESNEIINVLQNEISTGKEQIENLTRKLESVHELISEKQLLISSQKENIETLQTKFDGISHANDELKNIVATLKNNLTELNIQFELTSKDLITSRQESMEKDSTIAALSETLSTIREKLEVTLTEKRDCDVKNDTLINEFGNLKLEMKELSEEYEKCKLDMRELSEELRSSQALIKEKESAIVCLNQDIINVQKHLKTLTKEKESMLEDISSVSVKKEFSETGLQAGSSIQEFQPSHIPSERKILTHYNKILPKYDNKLEVTEVRSLALVKSNERGSSHNDRNIFEYNQKGCGEETHVQLKDQEMMELGENSACDCPDNSKESQHAEFVGQNKFEVPSIKNVIVEIQKQSKEYGILLEQHKNIIKHLEEISNFCNSTIEKDNYSWLQNQLMTLNRMYFTTMEKQNLQTANLNKLLKLQDITIKPLISDDNQSIEMQYLRNIVFQYMIGKETTLLAKVISAIMKFDQKQMDQVMQKEQQKQTLFGQLGLL